MFRFVSLLTTILACTQYTLGSNLHGASHHSPIGSIISSGQLYGQAGHGSLANSVISRNLAIPATTAVISSYGSSIIHPNSVVSHPYIGHQQQYISAAAAPLTPQIYSSPLVSGGVYGQHGGHGNSYAIQRSYTTPLAASSPLVSGGVYGQHGGYGNSYAIQRSISVPLAASSGHSGHGLYSAPIVANVYGGAQLGQAHHGGISGHLSGW